MVISDDEFVARKAELLDAAIETGEPLVVTRNGETLFRFAPTSTVHPHAGAEDLIGSVVFHISDEELVKYSAWEPDED
jgi:hypothetical protein